MHCRETVSGFPILSPPPCAGETNVSVRLGVVPATGGSVRWMDVHVGRGGSPEAEEEEYLARVMWLPDNSLAVQVLLQYHLRYCCCTTDALRGTRGVGGAQRCASA